MRGLVLIVLLLDIGATAQSRLDVQVSDSQDRPIIGLQLTAKQPSTTTTTDNAGKGTIELSSPAGLIDLVIVNRPSLRFVSPWTGEVPVPPNFCRIHLISKAQREKLEERPVVAALAAQVNWLLASKNAGPSKAVSREQAVFTVADAFGLDAKELDASFETVLGSSPDPYDLGQLALLNQKYDEATKLFDSALRQIETRQNEAETPERAFNAAFFLGQSLFRSGKFPEAALAYDSALKYHPNDPAILNSEGLTWSAAGKPEKAQTYFQKSIEVIGSRGSNLIDERTINHNLGYTYLQIGDSHAAKGDTQSATNYYQQGLLIQMNQFGPYSEQVAATQEKIGKLNSFSHIEASVKKE